jgi:hypothetical protein
MQRHAVSVPCEALNAHQSGTWRSLRRFVVTILAAVLLAWTAFPQVTSLYYQEVTRDGRIYVFNTPERYKAFTAAGEMGTAITLIGRGPNGETVVAENETAVDLFLFRHNLPAYERPARKPAPPALPFPQVKVGTTMFLSYQDGKANGGEYSKFTVKRGYLDVTGALTPNLSFRLTPDVTQDSTGDFKVRLKYAYAYVTAGRLGSVSRPFVEFGMVHTPWIDFEEKINTYRMQDSLFLERVGTMASADLGLLVGGQLGDELPAEAQKRASGNNPGRWGSFAIGIYNGGGYTATENNTNKAIEGRLSIRPLPEIAPGLQISYFGVSGKGNVASQPDWTASMASLTFESPYANLVGSYLTGTGNAAGTAVNTVGTALNRKGWSGFVEGRLSADWSLIARHDELTPDTTVTAVKTKRTIGGVCYHLGKGYDLLLDYDEITYEGTAKPKDARTQLTFQLKL